jgi:hypothetical protein
MVRRRTRAVVAARVVKVRLAGDSGWRDGVAIWWKERDQILGRVDEVAFANSHGEIDGVEVRLAVEAASQIGTWVDGGAVLLTTGTQEGHLLVALLVRERCNRGVLVPVIA